MIIPDTLASQPGQGKTASNTKTKSSKLYQQSGAKRPNPYPLQMKTNRTSPNGSAARAAKQAKKPTDHKSPKTEEPEYYELTFTCRNPTPLKPWLALTSYSPAEFVEIEQSARACGESLPVFLENAIKEKLAANAARAGKPVPVAKDQLQLLVSGNDRTNDCLWASPEGRLYLWTGELGVVAREVDFAQAREWWQKFQADAPYFAAPHFDEDSDAARIVSMVCEAINAKDNAPAASRIAGPSRVSVPKAAPEKVAGHPVSIGGDMIDALAILREKANAARALSTMALDVMTHDMQANEGWNITDMLVPEFRSGAEEVARCLFANMDRATDDFEAAFKQDVEFLRANPRPVVPVPLSDDEIGAVIRQPGGDPAQRLETSVSACKEFILLQGAMMSERKSCDAWNAVRITADELWAAFAETFRMQNPVRETRKALALAGGTEQRQAA